MKTDEEIFNEAKKTEFPNCFTGKKTKQILNNAQIFAAIRITKEQFAKIKK